MTRERLSDIREVVLALRRGGASEDELEGIKIERDKVYLDVVDLEADRQWVGNALDQLPVEV